MIALLTLSGCHMTTGQLYEKESEQFFFLKQKRMYRRAHPFTYIYFDMIR